MSAVIILDVMLVVFRSALLYQRKQISTVGSREYWGVLIKSPHWENLISEVVCRFIAVHGYVLKVPAGSRCI